MFKKMAAFIALIGIAGPAAAAGSGGTTAVSRITIEGGRVFIFGPSISNPDGCSTNGYVVIAEDVPNQAYFLSVALTAKATGRPISIWLYGCVSTNWHPSAPVARTLSIE